MATVSGSYLRRAELQNELDERFPRGVRVSVYEDTPTGKVPLVEAYCARPFVADHDGERFLLFFDYFTEDDEQISDPAIQAWLDGFDSIPAGLEADTLAGRVLRITSWRGPVSLRELLSAEYETRFFPEGVTGLRAVSQVQEEVSQR